ncbi:MAG: hypothetical protein SOY60_06990 [Fusobacterium gastrosuis]|uniref:hypothetical protein n=1 Tax=Fusobacterium gastrosuis TaxID=1755100 RepID=UPI002A8D8EF0|nr:hypothetical protein [Fusobacterium gastrosuis]
MATSIKLDKDCDIVFNDNGLCETVDNTDDIAQAIRVELEQNKEQYSLNTLFGVPYLNSRNTGLLQIKNNKNKILLEIRKVINKYKNVQIIELDFDNTNKLTAILKINDEVVNLINTI